MEDRRTRLRIKKTRWRIEVQDGGWKNKIENKKQDGG